MRAGPGETPTTAFRRELFKPGSVRALETEATFDDVTDPWDHFPDEPPRDIRTNPSNDGMTLPRPTPPPDVPFSIEPEADLPEPAEPKGHRWLAMGLVLGGGLALLALLGLAGVLLAAWLGVGVGPEPLTAIGL